MHTTFFVFFIAAAVVLSAGCGKKSPSASALKKTAPQVTDILKNKTAPQILEMKYGGENGAVKATCILETRKVDAVVPLPTGTSGTPAKPPGFVPPIQYPEENSVVYDLHSQQEVDKDLTQPVEITLSHAHENQVLNLKLEVAPVVFEPQLSLDIGNVKYIMKYSPVLSYKYNLEILSGESSSRVEGEGKVYEKVLTQQQVGENTAGENRYQHLLSCSLNTSVNDTDAELGREFEGHWRCINCAGPQGQLTPPSTL